MSTFNQTRVELTCPRCFVTCTTEVDLYLGDTSAMAVIQLGERYPLARRSSSENSTQEEVFPDAGYAECPSCGADYFCAVFIRDGRLMDVQVNPNIPPYIPDRVVEGASSCPECGSRETRSLEFRNLSVGRFLCDSPDCGSSWTTYFNITTGLYHFVGGSVPLQGKVQDN
jgi:Zn finger protein HypA/HybF involved in hydrogenase expression